MALAFAGLVQAAPLNVNFDNFTYSGSVTRYPSLLDAQNQTNSTGTFPIVTVTASGGDTRLNARDGNIAVTSEASAAYGSDLTYMSTAWYFTTQTTQVDGWGNPNNTNDGFIQYYLTSSPTVTGGWQPGHTRFRLTVAGGDGDSWDAARLWPAPCLGGGAPAVSAGVFHAFNLDVTANFASPATLNGATGWYEASAMPSSFSGTVSGIFENNNNSALTCGADSVGFYRFSYTLTGSGSWAADNSATYADGGETRFPPVSFWAAPAAAPTTVAPVPGPGKVELLGLSLVLGLMVGVFRRGAARSGRLH
ncbi:MAG: hypothetical protein QM772_15685 [Ottowia sp.]|uniref:hypothetical protein n=1 Tax=Ottowia sp. TaxID=1898956 RepID=UPI0039E2F408